MPAARLSRASGKLDRMKAGDENARDSMVPPDGGPAAVERFMSCLLGVFRHRPAARVAWTCEGEVDGPMLWDAYRAMPVNSQGKFRQGWEEFARSAGASEAAAAVGRIVASDAGGLFFADLRAAAPWHDHARIELTGAQLVRVLRRDREARRSKRRAAPPEVGEKPSARFVGVPELAKKLAALGETDRSGDPVTVKAVRSRLLKPTRFPPEYAELAGKKTGGRYPERAALAFLAAATRRLRADQVEREEIRAATAALRRSRAAERE